MLPENLKPFFWDVNFDNLRIESKREFIISRILDKGNDLAISWLFTNFQIAEIKKAVKINLNLSTTSLNLWQRVLFVDEQNPYKYN